MTLAVKAVVMTEDLPELGVEVLSIVRRDGEEIEVLSDGLSDDTAIALCTHAIAILTYIRQDEVEVDDD